MEGTHQITVTNHGEYRRWYAELDLVVGEKAVEVHTICYPRVPDSILTQLLFGTPEEIQSILSSLSNV